MIAMGTCIIRASLMADPVRDYVTSSELQPQRESRIEELLLAGLDHYFSGQHDLAISVWTRVLFLDRSHARARAYIERARGAIAERQREGEELLQTGAAAFSRGDTEDARRLLRSALDRGARPEEALAMLERLRPPLACGARPRPLAVRSPAPPLRASGRALRQAGRYPRRDLAARARDWAGAGCAVHARALVGRVAMEFARCGACERCLELAP